MLNEDKGDMNSGDDEDIEDEWGKAPDMWDWHIVVEDTGVAKSRTGYGR